MKLIMDATQNDTNLSVEFMRNSWEYSLFLLCIWRKTEDLRVLEICVYNNEWLFLGAWSENKSSVKKLWDSIGSVH